MKTLRDITAFENVSILVRASLNEPVENGVVRDTFRLSRAAATIKFLQERGARVIVISHIGEAGTETLAPVAEALGKFVNRVSFSSESIGPGVRAEVRAIFPGDVLVLENLRRHKGEVGNDPEFAKELASLADIFVEDAFDTCHREHASIVGVPKFLPSYAGLVLEEEVRQLSAALTPASPSLAIIGGAKFSTKEPVLTELLKKYDHVFVGGALANDFLAAEGHPVGKSLISEVDAAKMHMLVKNKKLVLPVDSVVSNAAKPDRFAASIISLSEVAPEEAIVDAGPSTQTVLADLVEKSKTILWNGPLGNYENGFVDATDALASAIAASTAHSIIGGGDTITAIEKLNILDRFSFVSTGGGAMLDFLATGTLPGIEVL